MRAVFLAELIIATTSNAEAAKTENPSQLASFLNDFTQSMLHRRDEFLKTYPATGATSVSQWSDAHIRRRFRLPLLVPSFGRQASRRKSRLFVDSDGRNSLRWQTRFLALRYGTRESFDEPATADEATTEAGRRSKREDERFSAEDRRFRREARFVA